MYLTLRAFHVLTHLILKSTYDVGALIIPVLYMWKLRHREVK